MHDSAEAERHILLYPRGGRSTVSLPMVKVAGFVSSSPTGAPITLGVSTASGVHDGPPLEPNVMVTRCAAVKDAEVAKTGHELLPVTTTTICPGSPHPAQVRIWFSAGPTQFVADVGTADRSVPLDSPLGVASGPRARPDSATVARRINTPRRRRTA
jgi:hypothetical protein